MKNPCHHCERQGCGVYHDKCPEYQEYRKKLEEEYAERLKSQQKRHDLNYIDHIHFMRLRKNKQK